MMLPRLVWQSLGHRSIPTCFLSRRMVLLSKVYIFHAIPTYGPWQFLVAYNHEPCTIERESSLPTIHCVFPVHLLLCVSSCAFALFDNNSITNVHHSIVPRTDVIACFVRVDGSCPTKGHVHPMVQQQRDDPNPILIREYPYSNLVKWFDHFW